MSKVTYQNTGRPGVRVPEGPPYGGIAQLGEHLPCTQGAKSSSLFISTIRKVRILPQSRIRTFHFVQRKTEGISLRFHTYNAILP